MEQEHKRRPGTRAPTPGTFQEKYKEHDPENYRSDVEKIIESGKTPGRDAHPHSGRRDPGGPSDPAGPDRLRRHAGLRRPHPPDAGTAFRGKTP